MVTNPTHRLPSPQSDEALLPPVRAPAQHTVSVISQSLSDSWELPGVLDQPEVLPTVRGPVADHRDGVVLFAGVAAGEDSSAVILERSGAGQSGYHGSKLCYKFL